MEKHRGTRKSMGGGEGERCEQQSPAPSHQTRAGWKLEVALMGLQQQKSCWLLEVWGGEGEMHVENGWQGKKKKHWRARGGLKPSFQQKKYLTGLFFSFFLMQEGAGKQDPSPPSLLSTGLTPQKAARRGRPP